MDPIRLSSIFVWNISTVHVLCCRLYLMAMHCGYVWPPLLFNLLEFQAPFQTAPLFELASASPNHLPAKGICQNVCYSTRFRPRYATLVGASLRRSLFLSVKLILQNHSTSTSKRRVPYSVFPILHFLHTTRTSYNDRVVVLYVLWDL